MALPIEQSSGGHDGVAVTRSNISWSNISWTQCRSAASGLAAAILLVFSGAILLMLPVVALLIVVGAIVRFLR